MFSFSGLTCLPARKRLYLFVLSVLISCWPCAESYGQEPDNRLNALESAPITVRPLHLSLIAAIEYARRNYPAIKTANLRADAAREGITQSKTSYLPRVDILLDENYGTANNITGFLAPQNIVPNISGLVKNDNNYQGGFGFTSGGLVSWEPFDFGLRKAQVNLARSSSKQAQAKIVISELDAMSRAGDAFLSALAAQQVVRAAKAKTERMNVFLETVRVLAQKELKPATDQYLAEAELVRAKDELIAANQNYKIAIVSLVESVGMDAETVELDSEGVLEQVPENHFSVADPFAHPLAISQKAAIELAESKKHAIEKSYAPRFYLRLPVYARGSSFNPNLSLDYGKGYYPTTFNYAVSALMIFPVMDIFSLRAQRRAEACNEQAERSRYSEIILNLKAQDARARAIMEGAILTAQNAPVKVKAASQAANSARIRYRYQLVSVNDVAQNEQLLTQSEVEFATAQLQVWRALLLAGVAHGDLKPFIEQVSKLAKQGR